MTGILTDSAIRDLTAEDGHLATGDTEQQTVELLLLTGPGVEGMPAAGG